MVDSLLSLKQNWERFTSAELTNDENLKKNCLRQFVEILSASPVTEECQAWCDVTNVGNVLSHKFLSEIHDICCSTTDDENSEQNSDNDDLIPLSNYLLSGQGWELLYIINVVGVQNLSCSRELSNLLISLLPVCFNFRELTKESSCKHDVRIEFENIDSCFLPPARNKILEKFEKRKFRSSFKQEMRTYNVARVRLTSNSSDSDFGLCRLSTATNYMNSIKRMINGSDKETASYGEDDGCSVTETNLSAARFCCLILVLLQKICYRDMLKQNLTTSPPSFTILPFALETLCSFYFGSSVMFSTTWVSDHAGKINEMLLRLVLISAAAVIVQPDGLDILEQQNNTIRTLIKLANRIYSEQVSNSSVNVNEEDSSTHGTSEARVFLSNVVYGLAKLTCHVIEWLSNETYCGQVIRLVSMFTILPLDLWSPVALNYPNSTVICEDHIIDLVHLLENMLISVKRLKVVHVHNSRCLKRRHKKCKLYGNFNHHHNILGFPSFSILSSSSPSCCVSYFCEVLVNIFAVTSRTAVQKSVLTSLKSAGICCCSNVDLILDKFLSKFEQRPYVIRINIMRAVENILIKQDEQGRLVSCTICDKHNDRPDVFNGSDFDHHITDTVDSAIGASEGSSHERSLSTMSSSGQSYDLYRQLLTSSDRDIQSLICNHLARLAVSGDAKVKQKIFVKVLLPFFMSADSLSKSSEVSSEVLLSCLSIIPVLLVIPQNLTLFLNHGGMKCSIKMLAFSTFRPKVLTILEVIINNDEVKNDDAIESDEATVPSKPVEEFQRLLIDKSVDFLSRVDLNDARARSNSIRRDKVALERPILCVFDVDDELIEAIGEELQQFSKIQIENCFNVFKRNRETGVEHSNSFVVSLSELEELADLWSSASRLFRFCATFKSYVVHRSKLNFQTVALELLFTVASEFSKCVHVLDDDSVKIILLNLLESLFVVCLDMTPITTNNHDEPVTSRHILKKLRCYLITYTLSNAQTFKSILDILMRCSLRQPINCNLHCFNRPTLCSFTGNNIWDDDDYDTLKSDMHHESDGYDADEEFSTVHESHHLNQKRVSKNKIFFAEVIRLMVDVMICKLDELEAGSEEEYDKYISVYVLTLQRLNSYLSESTLNTKLVYKQNILKRLLIGFKKMLSVNDTRFKDIQITIFSTISLIAKNNMSTKELQMVIDLFKEKTSPVDLLLQMLLNLVSGIKLQPTNLLSFPTLLLPVDDASVPAHILSPVKSTDKSSTKVIDTSGYIPKLFHWKHRRKTLPSPWAASSLALPLPVDLLAHPKNRKFSISFWMRVDRDVDIISKNSTFDLSLLFGEEQNQDGIEVEKSKETLPEENHVWGELVHILSIGSDQLLFEFWINPVSSCFVLRVSTATRKMYTILSETYSKSMVVHTMWHYVSVNYCEKSDKRHANGRVELTVDGLFDEIIDLDYDIPCISADVSPYLLIGQSCSQQEYQGFTGTWHLGNLMLFKDNVFTKESCLQMYALGPNLRNVTSCQRSPDNVYISSHISSRLLKSGVNWDILIDRDKQPPDFSVLQENIILTYSPETSSHYVWYPQSSSLASEMVGSLAQYIPVISNLKMLSNSSKPAQDRPNVTSIIRLASILNNFYNGIESAITKIGGVSIFVLLFARIVEFSNDERCQADSLKILLNLISKNPCHTQLFYKIGGYPLIFKVLSNNKCLVGYQILKVLLDACLNTSVLDYEIVSGRTTIFHDNESVIQDVDLLSKIVYNWRIWDRDYNDLWKVLFSCIDSLLRESHPYRDFNIRQVQSVYMVDTLLLICKERFYYEENVCMTKDVSDLFLRLIRRLVMTEPLNANVVMALCDSLLLLHKDTCTYVSISHPSFFYLMSTFTGGHIVPKVNQDVHDNLRDQDQLMLSSNHNSTSSSSKLNKYIIDEEIKSNSNSCVVASASVDTANRETEKQHGRVDNKSTRHHKSHAGVDTTDSNANKMSSSFDPGTFANVFGGCDEVDRKIQEAEENLSSAIWYAPLKGNDVIVDSKVDRRDQDMDGGDQTADAVKFPRSEPTDIDELRNSISRSPKSLTDFKNSKCESLVKESPGAGSYIMVGEEDFIFDSVDGSSPRSRDKSSKATTPEIISSEGDDWEVQDEEIIFQNDEKNGLVSIQIGLIHLLTDILMFTRMSVCKQILGPIVSPDILLILVHHKHPEVRYAVIQLFYIYLMRSSNEQNNSFIKMKGHYLLANQLFQYSVTPEIMDACFSMVFMRMFSLENPCNLEDIELNAIQLLSFLPIFSLLPKTHWNISLCHNVLSLIKQLCEQIPNVTFQLTDIGLLESVVRTLLRILHTAFVRTDVAGDFEQDILISDVSCLLSTITKNIMCEPGVTKFVILNDLFHILSHCERQEISHCGPLSRSVQAFRNCQIVCFETAFEHVRANLHFKSNDTSFLETFGNKLRSRKVSVENSVKEILSAIPSNRYASFAGRFSSIDDSSTVLSSTVFSDGTLQQNRSDENYKRKELKMSELNERFNWLIQKSCHFIIHREREYEDDSMMSAQEIQFVRDLLNLLIQGMANVMEKTRGKSRNLWTTILWSVRDTLRVQLSQLLVYLVSPIQRLDQRCYAATAMVEETKCKEVIKMTLSTSHQIERRIAIFLHDLLYGQEKDSLTDVQRVAISSFISTMQSCGLSVISPPPNTIDEWAMITEDKKYFVKSLQKERLLSMQKRQEAEYRIRHKHDAVLREVCEAADQVTQQVVLKQNSERKQFIEQVRNTYINKLEIRKSWQKLIEQLTHERGIWYFKESYPRSWKLDPTEGPSRVRKRLERCHLNLKPKYFLPESRSPSDMSVREPPLSYLLDDEDQSYDISTLINRLHSSEKISYNCTCVIITLVNEARGELLIGTSGIHFIGEPISESKPYHQWEDRSTLSMCLFYEEIKEVLKCRYELEDTAMEIFLTNGRTFLISFQTFQERNNLYDQLMSCPLTNLVMEGGCGNLTAITQKWRDRLITNFDYLMQVNTLAGRSFNDIMQYPVFPFVLSDYSSAELDLLDPSVYRNLSQPMAVQSKSREKDYIDQYNSLKRDYDSGNVDTFLAMYGPYHYGSMYSNSGTVLHFLVRLPPYTSLMISYQDNSFDIADRTFHCLQTSWNLASHDSVTDVKELIPEFFFLPEGLQNTEGFNLGIRQSGERVDDVILPNWCRSNARLFTLIHRQALESDYVTERISRWIDLIFGYKQTGKAAVDAVNVFYPVSYYGLDTRFEDEKEKKAFETMIRTYGQMPKQLFKYPHPMVALTFNNQDNSDIPNVMSEVGGLKWGNYVGSPSEPMPVIAWRRQTRSPVGSFVPLNTNDVFGLDPDNCLIVTYSKEKAVTLVTWGHSDGILRVKIRKDHSFTPMIKPSAPDKITVCKTVAECPMLFVGHLTGCIDVYSILYDSVKPQLDLKPCGLSLIGHKNAVTEICVCTNYSVLVTSSQDGTVIIWDLNKLSYVRCIDSHDRRIVKYLAVSDTSGEIASVSSSDNGSVLNLHTINGSEVSSIVSTSSIHSLCFSNAPEGTSVNVIATGMDDGAIKLWSTWDLMLVTEIRAEKFSKPVVCISFSKNSQHLYAANDVGTVIIWEKPSKGFNRTPKFLSLL